MEEEKQIHKTKVKQPSDNYYKFYHQWKVFIRNWWDERLKDEFVIT